MVSGFESERVQRNGFKPLSKTVVAAIIVSFAGAIGAYIWDLHVQLNEIRSEVAKDYVLMAVHKRDLDRLNNFMIEGRRFTLERGEDLERDLDKVAEDHKVLRLMVSENTLKVASMPHLLNYPFTEAWRLRISDLEKDMVVNKSNISELQRIMLRRKTNHQAPTGDN